VQHICDEGEVRAGSTFVGGGDGGGGMDVDDGDDQTTPVPRSQRILAALQSPETPGDETIETPER
jgi:hypothetical protein